MSADISTGLETVAFEIDTSSTATDHVRYIDAPDDLERRTYDPVHLDLPRNLFDDLGSPTNLSVSIEIACTGCGCTNSEACLDGCSWIRTGLCSSCV